MNEASEGLVLGALVIGVGGAKVADDFIDGGVAGLARLQSTAEGFLQ